LYQNLAWPHPEFFGEAWIVAAAALILLVVPVVAAALHGRSFTTGVLCLTALLLATHGLRVLLVWNADPLFDVGVRKILVSRLDLPVYGLLAAWLWVYRYAALMRWRRPLAILGSGLLGVSAWMHLAVALDASMPARIYLLPICDLGWTLILPWACSTQVRESVAGVAAVLAASAYAGLLTHMTVLRAGVMLGMPLVPASAWGGLMMLVSYVLLATGIALLVSRLVDQPWIGLRDRCLSIAPSHPEPVTER
jgi:hypothetical protein